jgi:septum formation protein
MPIVSDRLLILASRSPRRKELLEEAGCRFEVIPASEAAEGGVVAGESPADMVARLARQKAADVAGRVSRGIVLACDTLAECDGEILGKPSDREHARRMLAMLRGRTHRVLSGLCVWPVPGGTPAVRVAVSELFMDPLSDTDLEDYLAGGAWQGKAGAFGYQDRLGWVHILSGSASNVVGLPMELLSQMLAALPA